MIGIATCILAALLAATPANPTANKVQGKFVMNGTDAKLSHVRAMRTKLDEKGKPGYAVLLSAQPAEGEMSSWRTAEPSKRGNFIYLLLEPKGEVWVAELGHTSAKSGHFGVVTELRVAPYAVRGDRISGTVQTAREEEFGGDHYTVDLKFEATLDQR
ncbi:MAG TPA: hypothetical protein VLV78_07390 [Thermoanaerobaculia bacterium]|nr:hypothetical protein [Thermoanaerobaculia bacterium]